MGEVTASCSHEIRMKGWCEGGSIDLMGGMMGEVTASCSHEIRMKPCECRGQTAGLIVFGEE